MPRTSKDMPCADCGQLMWRSSLSLPEGQARCRPCRRLNRPATACERCGKNFTPARRGGKYCSRACHNPPRKCEVCSGEYRATYSGQRTCSRACGVKINARIKDAKPRPTHCDISWKQCPICEQWLAKPRRVLCGSDPCRIEYGRRRFAESFVSAAQPTTVPCVDCGQDYTTPTARNSGVCKPCQKRRHKARFGTSDRKRARYYGVQYEPIDRLKVYERDRWQCGLCGDAVKRDAKAPHPQSPSLDHIVPISRGGDHLYSNVQLAHFLCNSLKGDRGSQQLALVG